jgi:hypothetical protein
MEKWMCNWRKEKGLFEINDGQSGKGTAAGRMARRK